MYQSHPQIFNSTNILIADGAYDSIPLQKLTEKLNLKKLVTNKNIRNLLVLLCKTCCRNLDKKIKIKQLEMNLYDKMLLRKRLCVEHVINKYKKFTRLALQDMLSKPRQNVYI